MTSLALSFNDVNFSPVQQNGQVWLKTSELAEALGYSDQSGVTRIYSRNEDEFTQAMSCSVKLTEKGQTREIRVFSLRGCHLIAMFAKTAIAKQFRKWVLDILDREVLIQQMNSKQVISAEQCGVLYNIVHTRAANNQGLIKQMWSRLKNHFKYTASYRELRAIHFEDAKHYLEVMDLKVSSKQQEVKALPYPQEVVQVAQQIDQEYKAGRYDSWFVTARDGVLSVMPVPHGYYVFNVKEFTKHFDGVLNVLYGSDTLTQGRHFLNQAK